MRKKLFFVPKSGGIAVPEHPDLPWPKINDYLMDITAACNVDQLLHLALTNIGKLVPI
jgi:hypothetical protein